MKYLLGKTNIAGKQFSYNDVVEKKPTGLPYDYYGGNVQWFGKTKEGFLLCIRKNKAEIIDIYVDEDLLTAEGLKLLLKDQGKEDPAEANKAALIEQAKALNIKGVLQNMKEETLLAKIREATEGAKEQE